MIIYSLVYYFAEYSGINIYQEIIKHELFSWFKRKTCIAAKKSNFAIKNMHYLFVIIL